MSLMVTIMWLNEKGISIKFDRVGSNTEVTLCHGENRKSRVLRTEELFDAFNSDCYASKILKEMAVGL